MRASDLKPKTIYTLKGRLSGQTRRVRFINRSGPYVYVAYDYLVCDNDRLSHRALPHWYYQRIPPIEKLHINKEVKEIHDY